MKTCRECKKEQPLDNYHKMTKAPDGLQYRCKDCVKESEKNRKDYHKQKMKRLRANPEYRINEANNKRDYRLQYFYGITEGEYLNILEEQEHKCKICDTHQRELPRRLAVDHNHETGKVRGLLCDSCNRALGLFKDSVTILEEATEYLKTEGSYGA